MHDLRHRVGWLTLFIGVDDANRIHGTVLHRWFAWQPVFVIDRRRRRRLMWLIYVKRRWSGPGPGWIYRRIGGSLGEGRPHQASSPRSNLSTSCVKWSRSASMPLIVAARSSAVSFNNGHYQGQALAQGVAGDQEHSGNDAGRCHHMLRSQVA